MKSLKYLRQLTGLNFHHISCHLHALGTIVSQERLLRGTVLQPANQLLPSSVELNKPIENVNQRHVQLIHGPGKPCSGPVHDRCPASASRYCSSTL